MNYIKKLSLALSNLLIRQYLKTCYNSIHGLPFVNWIKLHEENNLKYLSKKLKENDYNVIVYEKLNDEIIDTFGASKEFLTKLKIKIDIEIMKAENKPLMFIEIKEEELKNIEEKKTDNLSFYDLIFQIEKQMNFKIDVNKISVFEFYNYCKNLSKNK